MENINKIIILINYDYRLFYYFREQMTSFKKQYVHKYNNKNKYEVYLIPRKKYFKRLQKQKYYENLYLKNKIMFYLLFMEKLFSKYIRKHLYKDLFAILQSSFITFIFGYFGHKINLKKLLPSF